MDQTTDTADLLETEKYLLNTVKEDSESDSDIEEEVAQDALLGGIRSTLSTITRTAREALSTCKNKPELDDAVSKIESSTLKLLKLEKSFLKTATIVSEVIDDLVSDFEDDEEAGTEVNLLDAGTSPTKGSGDATVSPGTGSPQPYIFQLSKKNLASVAHFKDKLSKEFHKRFDKYKSDLTDELLKEDDKFVSLLRQIKLGKKDAEKAMDEEKEALEHDAQDDEGEAEDNDDDSNATFLSRVPYTLEDLFNHQYKPYDEEKETDLSVLPTVDPITKDLIFSPLRNKFCNHVFDEDSIYDFISANPDATCPMHECTNKRPLDPSHLVKDPILTAHVRLKNFNSSV